MGEEGRRTREERILSGVSNRHTGRWTRRRPCSDEGRQGEEDKVQAHTEVERVEVEVGGCDGSPEEDCDES